MQFSGVDSEAVLVAHVHRDGAVLLQIADVLLYEDQGRIGRVFACTSATGRPSLVGRSKYAGGFFGLGTHAAAVAYWAVATERPGRMVSFFLN